MPVLSVEGLTLRYRTREGIVHAVEDASLSLERGESLGLVGESGCGKTTLALTLLRLLPDNAYIERGHIYLDGLDIVALSEEEMRRVRGRRVAMVFQAAMNALNPVYRVGDQVVEAILAHLPMTEEQARRRVEELFTLVRLDPALTRRYPHELSGGQRQRVMIAMALSCGPDLLVADEPTTALDVITQYNLLEELRELQRELNMTIIYISHDIALIAEVAQQIGVMYAGRLMEIGNTEDVFVHPLHPYTRALIDATPSVAGPRRSLATLPGDPPDLTAPPPGCPFHPRCPFATEVCRRDMPPLEEMRPGHRTACWHPILDSNRLQEASQGG